VTVIRRCCFFLSLILLSGSVRAFDVILPEDEAPAALFPVGRTDENVSLYIAGSWEAAVSAGLAVQFIPGTGAVSITSFPDMTVGAGFYQIPDITLSFRYLEKYFFETTLAEDFSDSTFLLGYEGSEKELLRRASIGNTGTYLEGFSYLELPDSPGNSLGMRVELAGGNSRLDTVLRYDPAEDCRETYRGMNRVEEAEIEPAGYIPARFFALPDEETESLRVYLETETGTDNIALTDPEGRAYRETSAGESWTSPSRGLIQCTDPPAGRVLATYKDMTTSGTVLGQSVADSVVTIPDTGTDYFILHAPGEFSPFEVARYYRVPINLPEESWRIRVYLTDEAHAPAESDRITFRHYTEDNTIALTSGAAVPWSEEYKYPLADDGLSFIYGPDREINPAYSRKNLLVEVLTPVEEIEIDPEYLPSSVKIYRNGYPETGFTIDEGGIISFDKDVRASDSIEIYYSVTSSSGEGGNLVFGTGAEFQPLPDLTLTTGLGIVWDVLSGSCSDAAGDNSGSVLLTGGLEYKRENLAAHFKAGLSVSNPDTTGYLRLKGMEETGITVGIAETSIFPSAVPTGYDRSRRGKLFYREYTRETPAGTMLMDYTWEDYTQEDYTTGSRTGPYTVAARSSENISGELMGLSWSIEEADGWAGAQLRVSPAEEGADLSSYRGLSFLWRGEDISANTVVTLQIGALGEDLDGDGALDEEAGPFDGGFPFNDTAAGAVLKVGAGPGGLGNGTVETEDADGDGLMDRENNSLIASYTLGEIPSDDRFRIVRIFFSETERKKLTNCTGIRVLVTSSSGDQSSGTLLIGEVRLEGSSFVPQQETVALAQVPETGLTGSPVPAEFLETRYPEVARVFHSSGAEQEVLDVRWNGDFTISSPVTPVPAGHYGRLVLYFAPLSLIGTAPEMTVSLADASGKGIQCSFAPEESTHWNKLDIDTAAEKVYINGEEITASLEFDSSAGDLIYVSVSLAGSTGGRMLMDEIIMTEPQVSLAGGAETDITWNLPGTLLSIGDVPVVSDLRLSAYLSGNSAGFLSGITPGRQEPRILSTTGVQASILWTAVSVDIDTLYDGDGLAITGSHTIRFPGNSGSYLEERYVHPGGNSAMERETRAVLDLPGALSCTLAQRVYALSGDLVQEWTGKAETRTEGMFAASATVDLAEISGQYSPGGTGYVGGWVDSYRLFAPVASPVRGERTGEAALDMACSFPAIAVVFEPDFSYVYNEAEGLQKNRGEMLLSVPFSPGDNPLNRVLFDITYRRRISIQRTGGTSTSFSEDLAFSADSFARQSFFFTHIPVYEIFSFSPDEAFGSTEVTGDIEYSEYLPSISFSLLRRYGSFIRDLFLPSSADISFSRELRREMESWTDSFVTDLSLTASAVNLFGSRGAYPTFSWFQTDEYSGSCTLSHGYPIRGSTEELSFVYQGFMSLTLEQATITSEHRLDFDITDTSVTSYYGKLEYEHQKPMKNPPELPFIARDIEKRIFLSHNECVEVKWNEEEEASTDVTVYGRHETAVVLPLFGSLSIFGRIGVKPEIMLSGEEEITTWLAAVKVGIEGNIRY